MTSQEAEEQVRKCERKIRKKYSNLKDAAKNMGSLASQAQSSSAITKTMLPLIISLIGLLFCFASHTVLGFLFIFLGIIIAFIVRSSADEVQESVEIQEENLNSIIEDNSKI